MIPYIEVMRSQGEPLYRVARHMLNLFAGQRGSRAWKRHLSEQGQGHEVGVDVLRAGLELVPRP